MIARQKALDRSAETCRLVISASQALFALAGEKELARRLRPKRRRRREAADEKTPRATAALRSAAATIFEWLRRVLGRAAATAGELLCRIRWKSGKGVRWPLSATSFSAPKA